MNERCAHELLVGQCVYCAPKPIQTAHDRAIGHDLATGRIRPGNVVIDWAAVVHGAGRPSASRPFMASYDGDCGECGGMIEEGDMIRMLDGVAIHDECWDEPQTERL